MGIASRGATTRSASTPCRPSMVSRIPATLRCDAERASKVNGGVIVPAVVSFSPVSGALNGSYQGSGHNSRPEQDAVEAGDRGGDDDGHHDGGPPVDQLAHDLAAARQDHERD